MYKDGITKDAASYSRRSFLRTAGLGLVALAFAGAMSRNRGLGKNNGEKFGTGGSLFEPRRQDLVRYWKSRLSRFLPTRRLS